MRLDFLTFTFFLISLLKYCQSLCALRQNCTDAHHGKCSPPDAPSNKTPFIMTNDTENICKEFVGKEVCCDLNQNIVMSKNFTHLRK